MNEQYLNALLAAVEMQRNSALNAAAKLEAELSVAKAEAALSAAEVVRLQAVAPLPDLPAA